MHNATSFKTAIFFDDGGSRNKMIDKWIEQLKRGNCIAEPDLKKLCIHVMINL